MCFFFCYCCSFSPLFRIIDYRAQQINGFSMWRNSISAFYFSPPPRVVADKLTFDRSSEQFRLGFHVLCVRDSLFHRKSNFRLSLEWKICWQLSIFHQMLIHFEQYLCTRVSTSQKTKTQGKLRKKNFQQNVKKSNNFMIFDTSVLLTLFCGVPMKAFRLIHRWWNGLSGEEKYKNQKKQRIIIKRKQIHFKKIFLISFFRSLYRSSFFSVVGTENCLLYFLLFLRNRPAHIHSARTYEINWACRSDVEKIFCFDATTDRNNQHAA